MPNFSMALCHIALARLKRQRGAEGDWRGSRADLQALLLGLGESPLVGGGREGLFLFCPAAQMLLN